MSKKKSPPAILPPPATVLSHHEKTLLGPLNEWLTQNKIPPVLLLTGPTGVGKRTMAYFIAQWALCEKKSATGACGECRSCKKAVSGTWVDFTEILPEGDDPGEPLKIEQFRKLKESLGFSAHEGPYRIVLISNAERMTPQAANSVLKILEEPPPGWIFLLTASDPSLLLPTLVSRCQFLRLKPFAAADLKKLLLSSEVVQARAEVCSTLAEGSWGRALELASDENWERRSTLFLFIENPESQLNTIVDWASTDEKQLSLLIDQMESVVSDLIRWSTSTQPSHSYSWSHQDGKQSLNKHVDSSLKRFGTKEHAREFWLARADRLGAARKQIRLPLNRKLLVQDILIPWVGSR